MKKVGLEKMTITTAYCVESSEAVENIVLDIASKNYGVVTIDLCRKAGINPSSFRKFIQRFERKDDILKYAPGVYVILPEPADAYDISNTWAAVANALGGEGSYLVGDSVLDFYDLANANPRYIHIATSKKRPKMPLPYRRVSGLNNRKDETTEDAGIKLQNPKYALIDAFETPKKYKQQGARDAYDKKLISKSEYIDLVKKLETAYV